MSDRYLKQVVQNRYGQRAAEVRAGTDPAGRDADPVTAGLYGDDERAEVPEEAVQASLGCGNPTALADLHPGQVVLDLGSGGGLDVLLAARRVGPSGKAYGLDMTDEMLALAEENKARAGVTNAEFLRGEIEDIPLPDASVDVIISNCVINLSSDKDRVLAEAFRVLRPGGRLAVSDMVLRKAVGPELAELVVAWTGCVAGALIEADYQAKLAAVGFQSVEIVETRGFSTADAHDFLAGRGLNSDRQAEELAGAVFSAFVRASKPA